MAKQEETQQTMEEYLLSQLDTPVVLKDGTQMKAADGHIMTKQEAIATNILNLAMKGDVKAAQYIQNIQMRATHKYQYGRFERSRQTGSGVSLRAKRTRISRIERIYD